MNCITTPHPFPFTESTPRRRGPSPPTGEAELAACLLLCPGQRYLWIATDGPNRGNDLRTEGTHLPQPVEVKQTRYCDDRRGCLVPTIATHLQLARPGSVLDLGIGMGFYGAIVRQWLDLGVQPWRTRLVGVEGFAGDRHPCWDLYDDVIVAPIEDFLEAATETWNAILLLEVLEHFPHSTDEQILLAAARGRLSPGGLLFLGTPAV